MIEEHEKLIEEFKPKFIQIIEDYGISHRTANRIFRQMTQDEKSQLVEILVNAYNLGQKDHAKGLRVNLAKVLSKGE